MVRDGLLPPRRRREPPAFTNASDAGPVLEGTRDDLGSLRLLRVSTVADSRLWNEVIARHHYLGHRPLVGAQMRYLIYAGQRLLAALGFASAAWRVLDRDDFIGWDDAQRLACLRLIVNNARFLIMPAVKVRLLASSILGQVTRQLPLDWSVCMGTGLSWRKPSWSATASAAPSTVRPTGSLLARPPGGASSTATGPSPRRTSRSGSIPSIAATERPCARPCCRRHGETGLDGACRHGRRR